MSPKEKQELVEWNQRHRVRMRNLRAAELVRASCRGDKKMTLYQASDACDFLCAALQMSKEHFADLVLAHAGCSGHFRDYVDPLLRPAQES